MKKITVNIELYSEYGSKVSRTVVLNARWYSARSKSSRWLDHDDEAGKGVERFEDNSGAFEQAGPNADS